MLHGGDVKTYEHYYKGEILDFSSNINPLGFPRGLKAHLVDHMENITSYPDIFYRDLKGHLANYLGCSLQNILIGNGAMEIIDLLMNVAENILIIDPSFIEYSLRGKAHGKNILHLPYKDDFSLDLPAIEKHLDHQTLLVLGNPNNPTALRIPIDVLQELYQMILQKDSFLVLDEAFFEFCPADYDSMELFSENEFSNIAIIRAATKFFAIPGLRLGYGATHEKTVKYLENRAMPWSVNTLADAAAAYIFSDKQYIEASKKYIEGERNHLLEHMGKIKMLRVFPTQTNFILLQILKGDPEKLFIFLLENGILIRKCSSFHGLNDTYIRVAIKKREANEKLLDSLRTFEISIT